MNEIYPYIIDPKETPAIWGGNALVMRFHKPGSPDDKLGESWECWDENRVANGDLAGATIAALRERLGPSLLGDLDAARIFPILTKIIDARDWLSVQVHPDDAYARRVESQPNGKTECWYVLSAEPGAQLVLGWTHDTSREEYRRRVEDGTLGDILRRVDVAAGDAYYLPAGTLHAIGAGIVLFETQQASDLTYRIFDWNRKGADGKARPLHIDKAADVLDYHRGVSGAVKPVVYTSEGLQRTALIADPHFVVERIVARDEPASLPTDGRPLILMTLDRAMDVIAGDVTVRLDPFRTALIPAASEWCTVQATSGDAPFMFVTPAQPATMSVRLAAAGMDSVSADAFLAQFA